MYSVRLVARHIQSFVTNDRHLLSAANLSRTTSNNSRRLDYTAGKLKSRMCLSVSVTGWFAKVVIHVLNPIYSTVPISVCMENRSLGYGSDPLVKVFLSIYFVSLIIISGCMSFFPFNLRLVECGYKSELALISCKIYSIISDPTRIDQCVQDNTITSVGS